MKLLFRFAFPVLISCFFIVSCSDIEVPASVEQSHYFKFYSSYYYDYLTSVEETDDDDGLLIAGYASEDAYDYIEDDDILTTETWPYFCKILPSGMVDWDTLMTEYDSCIAHHFVSSNSQDGYLSLVSKSLGNDSTIIIFQEVSSTGEFGETISDTVSADRVVASKVVDASDGTLKVVAQLRQGETEGEMTDVLTVYNLTNGTFDVEYSLEMSATIDGSFQILVDDDLKQVIVGMTELEPDNDDNTTDVRVLSVDGGGIGWDMNFGNKGVSETCRDLKIVDDKVVFAGNIIEDDNVRIAISIVDMDGARQRDSIIVDSDEALGYYCNSFTINDSNNYVFTGYYYDTESLETTHIFFAESSQDGTLIQHTNYGEVEENEGRYIKYLGDGNYFLLGELTPGKGSGDLGICLFKIDESGNWVE